MTEIGSELRWVLLLFSVALIVGLYVVGRWGRRQSVATDVTRETGDRSYDYDAAERDVPRLSDVVVTRERHAEPRVMFVADDDLPDIRVDSHIVDHSLSMSQADISAQMDAAPVFDSALLSDERYSMDEASFDDGAQLSSGSVVSEPMVESSGSAVTSNASAAAMQRTARASAVSTPASQHGSKKPGSRKIIALRLVAGAQRYEGGKLKDALENAKLRHGKYGIYHRQDEQDVTLFSVASMVEPGTFDPATMATMQFTGVLLFAQLPGPTDGVLMFEQMLECAERLAGIVGGTVQDERGAVLTPPRAARLRDDIENFQHLLGVDMPAQRAPAGEGMSAP